MNSQFRWFEEGIELERVKWVTFHVIGRDLTETKLAEVCPFDVEELSPDLRTFFLRYGNCRLFRRLRVDWHRLKVTFKAGEWLGDSVLLIGQHWEEAECFVKPSDPKIYGKWGSGGVKVMEIDFTNWLKKRVRKCKSEMKGSDWAMVMEPPRPFDKNERQIVDAMALYRFKKVGVTSENNVLIEIDNGSETVLPRITIGVNSEKVKGAVRVDGREIPPKTKKVVAVNCYKEIVSPTTVEIFKLPAPTPEDRFRFSELLDIQTPSR